MTTLKLASKMAAAAQTALDPHVTRLYDRPGARVMAIIEMAHVERLQPAPGSDKTQAVTMKITACEVPTSEQEPAVREAQRALYLARTAAGTLDEDGQVVLDDDTLRLTGGLLTQIELARLRVGVAHWARYARRVVDSSGRLTASELAHEAQAVADGLTALLGATDATTEGDPQ